VIEARIQGKVLTQEQIQLAMLTGSLLLGLIVLSWLIFLFYGYPPLPALFEVVSAVGTVGLSAGVTQADLPLALKTVLCIDMIAGRVEVVALLCCLYPGVWLGHRNPAI
jgi:trk system potassium uptake protein TrkH